MSGRVQRLVALALMAVLGAAAPLVAQEEG